MYHIYFLVFLPCRCYVVDLERKGQFGQTLVAGSAFQRIRPDRSYHWYVSSALINSRCCTGKCCMQVVPKRSVPTISPASLTPRWPIRVGVEPARTMGMKDALKRYCTVQIVHISCLKNWDIGKIEKITQFCNYCFLMQDVHYSQS
jgi:hypothetical protein